MSALGSYVVIERGKFNECLDAARQVRTETTGRIFKKTQTVGLTEFEQKWSSAVLKKEFFDYSGYVLGNYLDAQLVINGDQLVDEESEVITTLNKVFLAAFVFKTPTLKDLPREQVVKYCREEYSEEGDELVEPLAGAHEFFKRGLAEVTSENLVVFLIV